jgi:outer membrane immunogenic protein
MRRQILLASVGAIAIAGSAYAADLPYRGPPPVYLPPPPIFTWTGIYVGGQIGYAWARDNISVAGSDEINFVSSTSRGVIGGAHLGYNLQIGQWVAGIEGTVDGTSLNGSVTAPGEGDEGEAVTGTTVGTRPNIQGSIRGRVGIAFDRVLIYATGGAAFAGIKNNYTDTGGNATDIIGITEGISKTRSGWTVGGGIAYAITNNWSLRAEYRYSDFGRYTDFPFTAFTAEPEIVRHHLTENQVQAGFSYKFDSLAPAPVVAKY